MSPLGGSLGFSGSCVSNRCPSTKTILILVFSSKRSPSVTTRFAILPFSMEPRRSATPKISAGESVNARRAASGARPAAKKSIDAGLAPEAALRAFTLSPAEIFGVADRLGSIENGKIANLVVTDGDLFEEKTKIKMVFVDGQRFETHEPEKPKEPPKGDITGKWKLAYTTPEGAEESTADLVMDKDGAISGSLGSSRGTANIISGYLSGDKFK